MPSDTCQACFGAAGATCTLSAAHIGKASTLSKSNGRESHLVERTLVYELRGDALKEDALRSVRVPPAREVTSTQDAIMVLDLEEQD